MVNDNCKMSEEELERALKCDAAVLSEHRGIMPPSVASPIPRFGHEQAEVLFANLADRVVALEAEVAALKAAKV